MLKLVRFLKPYKKECILGPMFKLFEALLELVLPTIMALIINNGVITKDTDYIIKMGIIMVIMAILGFVSATVCQYMASKASQGSGTDIRNSLVEHIIGLSHSEIEEFGTSSLINRITNDVNQIQLAVAMLIRLVVRAPFILFGAIVMAVILDFKLSLILIATTPFFAVILYFFINKTSPMYKIYQGKLDKLSLRISESLGGARVIRAFATVPFEEKKFKEDNNELTYYAIAVGRVSALLNPLTSLVINISIIVLLLLGAIHINEGRMSEGTIIAFINYVTQVLLALIIVSNLIIIFTKAQTSANRINEIFETNSSIIDSCSKLLSKKDLVDEIINFKDVTFSYNKSEEMALCDINIKINKGDTIGIIGGTGSGKSTFINLIGRFYDATTGEILIEGTKIQNYPLKELRNKISMVPQSLELFTGTIKENLLWGNEDATTEEIIKASKIAQAHEFINELENGYETEITRGGKNFSGGQRQRLTIARAIVREPEILILDDSSSALDFATDAALRKAIKENSKNMTVIIVSQRVSTIKEADRIIVFDDGMIVGSGTDKELLTNCEIYIEICTSQITKEEALNND